MHILSLLGYLFLLATSGVLLFALLRAQRTTRELAEQLALAREQHHLGSTRGRSRLAGAACTRGRLHSMRFERHADPDRVWRRQPSGGVAHRRRGTRR